MNSSVPAVLCRDLQKSFGDGDTRVDVLRGVNFSAAAGEITFLLGPSGCGKTTLISVLAGLLDPTGGRVELFGRGTEELPSEERRRLRCEKLGFVFQQHNLLSSLTATENAAIPLLAAGHPRKEALQRARDLLLRLGLQDRLDTLPSRLSGGQQQRVALARALVHEPQLVFCDEPTAALDHAMGEVVMRLLADVALVPGRAVVVVTHDTRVLSFAHTIARMEDGVVAEIRPGENRPPAFDLN